MARVYIPLDKGMTDEEIVRAFKDAATKMRAETLENREAVERTDEPSTADESDGKTP
jgi:hypothetical protein